MYGRGPLPRIVPPWQRPSSLYGAPVKEQRTGSSRALDAVMRFVGLRDDPSDSEAQRRSVDLLWAVFGPVLIVLFVWTLLGQAVGMIAVLVMLPFLVVGVYDVLSGRAAERNAQRRAEKRQP